MSRDWPDMWASRTLALPAFREASDSPPGVSSATRTLVPSGVRGNPPDWLRANATAGLIRRCGEAGRRIKAERAAKIYTFYNVIGLAKLNGTSAAATPSRDPMLLLRAPNSDLSWAVYSHPFPPAPQLLLLNQYPQANRGCAMARRRGYGRSARLIASNSFPSESPLYSQNMMPARPRSCT